MIQIKYNNLYAIKYSKPYEMDAYGYKYVIPCDGLKQAYHTDSGFNHFMEIYNLKIKRIETFNWKNTTDTYEIIYFEPVTIYEPLTFWKKEDLKKGMKHFIGLSNGSYVDCFYKHYKNYVLVMRPNPNAKEVYKPYNYTAMREEWG